MIARRDRADIVRILEKEHDIQTTKAQKLRVLSIYAANTPRHVVPAPFISNIFIFNFNFNFNLISFPSSSSFNLLRHLLSQFFPY